MSADFSCTGLWGARFAQTDFRRAQLDGARIEAVSLADVDLREARLNGAGLGSAWLDRANLRSADLAGSEYLIQEQMNSAFGDSGTKLPEGIVMPDHWDDQTIWYSEDDSKYQAWLAAGAPPGKPRKPPPE